jgi:uncharacterized membrane protein YGL010W
MRILFKIILFPITLVLSIVVGVCRFVCGFSGAVLGVISTLLLTLALLTLILLKEPSGALTTAIIAFVVSPYGIPKLAEWLIDRLEDLNFAIKSI